MPFDTGDQDNKHAHSQQTSPGKSNLQPLPISESGTAPRTTVEVQSHIARYGTGSWQRRREGFAKRAASVQHIHLFIQLRSDGGDDTARGFDGTGWGFLRREEKRREEGIHTSGKVGSMDLVI